MVILSNAFTRDIRLITLGPIPNPNPGWLPARQQAARNAGTKSMYLAYALHMPSLPGVVPDVTPEENQSK